jgi:hypothetical protein
MAKWTMDTTVARASIFSKIVRLTIGLAAVISWLIWIPLTTAIGIYWILGQLQIGQITPGCVQACRLDRGFIIYNERVSNYPAEWQSSSGSGWRLVSLNPIYECYRPHWNGFFAVGTDRYTIRYQASMGNYEFGSVFSVYEFWIGYRLPWLLSSILPVIQVTRACWRRWHKNRLRGFSINPIEMPPAPKPNSR